MNAQTYTCDQLFGDLADFIAGAPQSAATPAAASAFHFTASELDALESAYQWFAESQNQPVPEQPK